MERFKEIAPNGIGQNIISMIGDKWMLITAGNDTKCNAMTASWGGMGVLWNSPAAFIFIRPQRYTKEFVDANDRLTLSFLGEEYRKALTYCGTRSGRKEDKIANSGLTILYTDAGTPAIAEAELIVECGKLYAGHIYEHGFIDKSIIDKWYPEKDYHCMYVCGIEKVFVK